MEPEPYKESIDCFVPPTSSGHNCCVTAIINNDENAYFLTPVDRLLIALALLICWAEWDKQCLDNTPRSSFTSCILLTSSLGVRLWRSVTIETWPLWQPFGVATIMAASGVVCAFLIRLCMEPASICVIEVSCLEIMLLLLCHKSPTMSQVSYYVTSSEQKTAEIFIYSNKLRYAVVANPISVVMKTQTSTDRSSVYGNRLSHR